MDTTNLTTFLTIAELKSFTQAAETLFLTQPAISKRIKALETEMNAKLFDRLGRQTTLTEAGHILYKRAQIILQQMQEGQREIQNLSRQVTGKLSIATSHHIGLHRLPPALEQYNQQYPDVLLDLHFMDSEQAYHQVMAGKFELAIITIPNNNTNNNKSELIAKTIWEDKLEFVVGPTHELVSNTNRSTKKTEPHSPIHKSLTELAQYPAILPAKNTYTRQIIEQTFKQSEQRIATSMSTNYLETIKMLVKVGLGWSILPHTMLTDELTILKINNITLTRHLGLVRHPARTLSNAATAMVSILG
ncbi:MAG: LysR family transcriptional regulator [Gammaproteobacteria bacterium]|nr:LysR family transcriptional regulator [Gammaproteobacteria bacterium]